MKTFQEMGLPEALTHTLQHMQFNKPTPIQVEAIPPALGRERHTGIGTNRHR